MAGKQFLQKVASSPTDTLWVRNFFEIALSRSVSKINGFLCLTQKFKMAVDPVGQKFRRNRSILFHFRNKHFFTFNAEIQDGCQKWQENDLLGKVTSTLRRYPVSQKLRRKLLLSGSVFEINMFLRLTQKFKMAAKSGWKTIFCKKSPVALHIPCGSKISSKLLHLTPFPR